MMHKENTYSNTNDVYFVWLEIWTGTIPRLFHEEYILVSTHLRQVAKLTKA